MLAELSIFLEEEMVDIVVVSRNTTAYTKTKLNLVQLEDVFLRVNYLEAAGIEPASCSEAT